MVCSVCKRRSVAVIVFAVFCACRAMGVKAQRPRCFFDIGISNVPGETLCTAAIQYMNMWNVFPCIIFFSRWISLLQRAEWSLSFSRMSVPKHVKTSAACAQVSIYIEGEV